MTFNRVENQENPLAVILRDIETQIQEIKNKQLNGTDTIQTYQNQTEEEWDIDWTPTWVLPQISASRDFSLIFEAERQDAAVNSMSYDILIDNTHRYTVASFDYHPLDAAVLGYVHDSFLSYASEQPAPKKDGWYFAIGAYRSGMNIKIKFTVHSTDTGDIRITELT